MEQFPLELDSRIPRLAGGRRNGGRDARRRGPLSAGAQNRAVHLQSVLQANVQSESVQAPHRHTEGRGARAHERHPRVYVYGRSECAAGESVQFPAHGGGAAGQRPHRRRFG